MPVGVQCPASLPHIGEFGIAMALVSWAFARIGVHRPSLRFRLGVFHSLLSAIGFQSCFFFTADVLPPIRSRYPLLTHFLGEFPWLGTGSGTRCCGHRGGTAVRMEQKIRSKFLPWPG